MKSIKIIKKFFASFAFFAVVFLFSVSVFAQGKFLIRVSGETNIEKDRVTLGDVAEISGAGDEESNRLQKISLGYAPNVGMSRELFRDRISLSIAAAGFTKNDFSLLAPPKIVIRRVAQIVENDALREAVEKAVLAEFQNKNVTAKIVRLDIPANIQIPTGTIEILTNSINTANLFAPFSVSLEIRVNEKTARRVSATVQVEATAEILIAARDMTSGEKITEADVRKETRRLEKPLSNYWREAENLRGTILLKNLSAGTEITSDAVAAGYVIRIGDSLRIVGESGKMQIIVNGEARSSGRIGDRIAVKNLQSGAILQAFVVDEGLVRIVF